MGLFGFLFGKHHSSAVYMRNLVASGAVIVDVRSPEEFRGGHLRNSLNIPLQSLAQQLPTLKQKNKPIITVCKTGARSSMAVGVLKNAGIEAYNGGPWNVLQHQLA
ncbi:MAG: rhodanese-like domain-containing protein [Bacteroidota bacterium]|nr:rhodanese-like domain-containing protein [Bacteroidota bacterium]